MTTNPITPPRELISQWLDEFFPKPKVLGQKGMDKDKVEALLDRISADHIATQAARWGSDQELEAVCELLDGFSVVPLDHSANLPSNRLAARDRVTRLRAARRPKPPSLKEQALAVLDDCADRLDAAHENTIRRALEALDA